MVKFDITQEALEDLFKIWEYTFDTWSEKQADKYYSILVSSFNKIAASPIKVGKPYDEIIPGLRALHVRRHMVFFTTQGNGRPLIARVLHESMDYIIHFGLW